MTRAAPALRIVPANEATREDLEAVFAAAGFAEVTRPTLRRAVMRIDF
jgi:hypothetical protein